MILLGRRTIRIKRFVDKFLLDTGEGVNVEQPSMIESITAAGIQNSFIRNYGPDSRISLSGI